MGTGVPLFGVELIVHLDFVVDGLGVLVGDILLDDLLLVLGEEFLDVPEFLPFLWVHSIITNQIKNTQTFGHPSNPEPSMTAKI